MPGHGGATTAQARLDERAKTVFFIDSSYVLDDVLGLPERDWMGEGYPDHPNLPRPDLDWLLEVATGRLRFIAERTCPKNNFVGYHC